MHAKSKCTNFGLVILLFVKLSYFDDLLVNAAKPAFLNHIVPGTKLLDKKIDYCTAKKNQLPTKVVLAKLLKTLMILAWVICSSKILSILAKNVKNLPSYHKHLFSSKHGKQNWPTECFQVHTGTQLCQIRLSSPFSYSYKIVVTTNL